MQKALFLLLVCGLGMKVVYAQKIDERYVDGEVYVKLKDTKSVPNANSIQVNIASELPFLVGVMSQYAPTARRSFYFSSSPRLQRVYRIKINNPTQIKEFMANIVAQPDVEYVERVPLAKRVTVPNDPSLNSQYHLTTIQAPQAWAVTTGTNDVTVAVVDDAVQTTHPDLTANCVAGFDVADNDNNPNPPNTSFDHGTHVAGIVGAVTNNGVGIASVGFNKVKIMGIKSTGDNQNPLYIYYGYEGIEWASLNGAKVINMSWGGSGFSQTEQDAITAAVGRGVILVAAAGNNNSSVAFYPAAYAGVISVASTDAQDKKSSFSNYGSTVDIAAPGSSIYSTMPFGTYQFLSGTSMASPLVASVCGFIWSVYPTFTPAQVEQILKATADNIDTQNPSFVGQLGAGRVNVWKAVACQNNLFSVSVASNVANLICPGESIALTATPSVSDPTITYQWRYNNANVGTNTPNFAATAAGAYSVVASRSGCTVSSQIINILANPLSTPPPTVTNRSLVCGTALLAGNGLQASAPNCPAGGPQAFGYAGGTVGYDAGSSSGPNPTASVSGIGGVITQVSVSITWEKKGQADQNACGLPHQNRSPWNDEVSFKLQGPDGTTIALVNSGTYGGGYAGTVTTVFQTGGAQIGFRSQPTSGTFTPAEPLTTFNGKLAFGTWTLIPDDNGFLDPLCVQAFSVTITTNAMAGPPTYQWWDAASGGNLLGNSSEYLPTATSVGAHTYYATAQCTGACVSTRTPATFTVEAGPKIAAFPIIFGSPTAQSAQQIIGQKETIVTLNGSGNFQLFNPISTQSVTVSNRPPLVEPVTICAGQFLLLLAVGCQDGVTWFNGSLGVGNFVSPSSTTTYTYSCNMPPNCPWSGTPSLTVRLDAPALTVSNPVPANALQTFRAGQLTVENVVSPTANVQYLGTQSVLFTPGFQSNPNSVVKAQIAGCN
ncbi:MAG: S8 family serine peptidase [Spirosomaceae bacterium]|nr:S8 family serine peptidase [Spirosomataceae bacterium]